MLQKEVNLLKEPKMELDCMEITFPDGKVMHMPPYLDEGVSLSEILEHYGEYPMIVVTKDGVWTLRSDRDFQLWEEEILDL